MTWVGFLFVCFSQHFVVVVDGVVIMVGDNSIVVDGGAALLVEDDVDLYRYHQRGQDWMLVLVGICFCFWVWLTEWWLMDRLAQSLVLVAFHLLDQGVSFFWPPVGFPMLYIYVPAVGSCGRRN